MIVWGPYNAHRQVVVTQGTYESMRTDALESLSRAGVETRGVFVDIAPVGPSGDKAERRPVVVALAAATPIMSALQPIIDAGIRVRSVATPATALSSLARLRRSLDAPGIEAYVAVEEDATCIAVNRGGTLIAGRELPWGYFVDRQRSTEMRRREDIAARLAEESYRSDWRRRMPRERAAILFRVAELIREHGDELASIESRNVGKPMPPAARIRIS